MGCDVVVFLKFGVLIGVFDCYLCFFFFKQKTAYEMRISDWSSDVCSSDLRALADPAFRRGRGRARRDPYRSAARARSRPSQARASGVALSGGGRRARRPRRGRLGARRSAAGPGGEARRTRSEEHTSELQSLMRISYAVFCLKKKNKTI